MIAQRKEQVDSSNSTLYLNYSDSFNFVIDIEIVINFAASS